MQHLHGHGGVPGGSQGVGVSKAGDAGRSEDGAVTHEGGPFPCLLGAIPFCLTGLCISTHIAGLQPFSCLCGNKYR